MSTTVSFRLGLRDVPSFCKSLVSHIPQQRSYLIDSAQGELRGLYAGIGLSNGIQFLLSTPASIFITTMAFYRLGLLIKTGNVDWNELYEEVISANSVKGLESFAVPLARLPASSALMLTVIPSIGLLVFNVKKHYK